MSDPMDLLRQENEWLKSDNRVLRAKLDVACKALKPFARAVDNYASAATDEYPIDRGEFALGELRRARAVYEKIKGGGNE